MSARFLTLADVADVLNVSGSQAYALVRSGETLRMDVTVVQSGAGIGTISTEYGVNLSGLLVRFKGDR